MRRRAVALLALGAAAALAGCGTVSPQDAMRTWASGGQFAQSVETLLADSKALHHEIALHRSATDVKTLCAELFLDANGANTDELPSPDAALTGLLSAAYDRLVQAAARCTSAPGDRAALTAVDQERHHAVGLLIGAVLREEALSGRPLGVPGIP